MPFFSVVVVARNEASTLPRLVRSLEAFRRRGGDVLVVDTGSNDETVDVARGLGCAVAEVGERFTSRLSPAEAERIEERFAAKGEGPLVSAGQRLFDFGKARQLAGELAARDFVWQVDGSDEALALDVERLDARIAGGRAAAFSHRLRLGGLSFDAVRFYDRRWHRWVGRAHEGLYPAPGLAAADVPPTVRCDEQELLVTHHRRDKARHYLAGLALDAIDRPDIARWSHYLGRELSYQGWHRSAVRILEHHATRADAMLNERSQSLCFAGECLDRLGEPEAAASAFTRAAAMDTTWREPLLRLAALLTRRGDFAGAAETARRALAIRLRPPAPEADANYTWLPHGILYWSLFWLGRREEAGRHWEIFRTLAPPEAREPEHARMFRVHPG